MPLTCPVDVVMSRQASQLAYGPGKPEITDEYLRELFDTDKDGVVERSDIQLDPANVTLGSMLSLRQHFFEADRVYREKLGFNIGTMFSEAVNFADYDVSKRLDELAPYIRPDWASVFGWKDQRIVDLINGFWPVRIHQTDYSASDLLWMSGEEFWDVLSKNGLKEHYAAGVKSHEAQKVRHEFCRQNPDRCADRD